MPTPTYDLIASNVLSSSASSVTFSSIPATYRDLVLVCTGTTTGNELLYLKLNNDTSTIYNHIFMVGNGSTATSGSQSDRDETPITPNPGWNSSTVATTIVQLFDYAQTNKHKSGLTRSNNAALSVLANAIRYASTSAITEVTVRTVFGNNFASGSSFHLYGIAS
jgi:hypothetical protein